MRQETDGFRIPNRILSFDWINFSILGNLEVYFSHPFIILHLTLVYMHITSQSVQHSMQCGVTLDSESKVPFPRQLHHPISSASFNLKGWNLVCATGWPKSALTQNFSPVGPVVAEIWQNMWEKSHKKREKERVLKMTKKSRKIGNYSETTGPNELKFCLVLGFRHRMPHTKFQPDCLKSV